jgi:hypothetical protein
MGKIMFSWSWTWVKMRWNQKNNFYQVILFKRHRIGWMTPIYIFARRSYHFSTKSVITNIFIYPGCIAAPFIEGPPFFFLFSCSKVFVHINRSLLSLTLNRKGPEEVRQQIGPTPCERWGEREREREREDSLAAVLKAHWHSSYCRFSDDIWLFNLNSVCWSIALCELPNHHNNL